uniref:Uncharacterized protein n=1 Tax=Candidatus Kentrum sp. SD TaxID=2126332 RepID=A0A450YNA5_9GAMM|nr:MAG: hypothetical protein BECKSD772F_GA0070984_11345 [Candidatus Kentron sp. SD]VFK48480.1 MAG: hypothetical protein BECKSD772E_GA0070983_11266 [Candidatus Kentron sp. SD]
MRRDKSRLYEAIIKGRCRARYFVGVTGRGGDFRSLPAGRGQEGAKKASPGWGSGSVFISSVKRFAKEATGHSETSLKIRGTRGGSPACLSRVGIVVRRPIT